MDELLFTDGNEYNMCVYLQGPGEHSRTPKHTKLEAEKLVVGMKRIFFIIIIIQHEIKLKTHYRLGVTVCLFICV